MLRASFLIPFIGCGVLSLSTINTFAHDWSGDLSLEYRYFFHDALYPRQENNSASTAGYAAYYHDYDDYSQRVAATLFARYDSVDDNRSHADIRELYWWRDFESFQIFAGVRKVYWGVAESLHLVDILNQDDVVENLDREDKLGQPMVQLLIEKDWGTVQAFLLPYFREQEFPGENGRLRPSIPIADEARYESGAEEKHVDVALRWSHYVDIWDIGVAHFSGTNRDPFLMPVMGTGGLLLQPFYSQIEQTSVDVQATLESWLWKLELISVDDSEIGRYTAAVGGFEYTFYGIAGGNSDLGFLAEYQYDNRDENYAGIGQNDLALGVRWSINDLAGSEVLAVLAQDLDEDNQFLSIEASTRLTDAWEFSLEVRFFNDVEPGTIEYSIRDDDYLQAQLSWYF